MVNHRHTRGIVLDLNSEVCPKSFLSDSKIGEATDVYISNLTNSWVNSSTIVHSNVTLGDVQHSEVVMSVVDHSDVINSKVYDGAVIDSKLENVTLRGGVIKDCLINADVVVGDAILEGLIINQDMRIGTGHWTRIPRRFEVNNDVATGVIVTESTDGCAYIGCQRKPMATWIKGSRRFGKVIGWDQDTIDYIVLNFKEWLKDNHGRNV